MTSPLAYEKVWTDRQLYEEAERKYYENVSKVTLTPLADEVAKARQRLIQIRDNFGPADIPSVDPGAIKFLEKKFVEFQKIVSGIQEQLNKFDSRLSSLEKHISQRTRTGSLNLEEVPKRVEEEEDDDDDDVDLFGSESEEENDAAVALRKERLAAYESKTSKKPALIAKSSIILDIKPWDDTTDMKVTEENVRKIQMDGLLWGASKLVPIAFGIHKLQINCVIEDDKVSVDLLQEQIEQIEDYVQSVDIAAFNKI